MPHRQWPSADKAFPALAQSQSLGWTADRIGPVQYPHRLAVLGSGFEHIPERSDERVDAAAQVLQIDQDDIERIEHGRGRPTHFAVQTEHRDAVHRIKKIRRLDHVVLFVTAQTVLRTECGIDAAACGERIERMRQVRGDRRRMRQQGNALARERCPQRGIGDEAVDAELHGPYARQISHAKQSA